MDMTQFRASMLFDTCTRLVRSLHLTDQHLVQLTLLMPDIEPEAILTICRMAYSQGSNDHDRANHMIAMLAMYRSASDEEEP